MSRIIAALACFYGISAEAARRTLKHSVHITQLASWPAQGPQSILIELNQEAILITKFKNLSAIRANK